jgi:hypothetical protein
VVDGQEEDAVGIENEADGQNKTMDLGPAGKGNRRKAKEI